MGCCCCDNDKEHDVDGAKRTWSFVVEDDDEERAVLALLCTATEDSLMFPNVIFWMILFSCPAILEFGSFSLTLKPVEDLDNSLEDSTQTQSSSNNR